MSVRGVGKGSRGNYFEIRRTPPDIRRKREDKKSEDEEETVLLLTPFSPVPKVDFGEIRLGKAGVRRIVFRNSSGKSVCVLLEKVPKEEKGFRIDYVGPFDLPGGEEALLSVGWVPKSGGAVRETISVKYGPFKTLIQISGTCLDPEAEKQRRFPYKRPPLKNHNKQHQQTAAKVVLPANPITKMVGVPPPIRIVAEKVDFSVPDVPRKKSQPLRVRQDLKNEVFMSWSPQPVHFMDGSFLKKGEEEEQNPSGRLFQEEPKNSLPSWTTASPLRRETFVSNSWTPANELISRKETIKIDDPFSIASEDFCNNPRRDTYVTEGKSSETFCNNPRRDTYVTEGSSSVITPPHVDVSLSDVFYSVKKNKDAVLEECETVKTKLEESGILKDVLSSSISCKGPSKKFRPDLLSDIQTNLIQSPVRTSSIISKIQTEQPIFFSDPDLNFELSPDKDKENQPPRPNFGEEIDFECDLSLSPQQPLPGNPKILQEYEMIYRDSEKHLVFTEEIIIKETVVNEVQVETELLPDGGRKIISEKNIGTRRDIEEFVAPLRVEKYFSGTSFAVPVSSKEEVAQSTEDIDDVSLLIANQLKVNEEKDFSNIAITVSQPGHDAIQIDDTKKYDYKEDTIYETNLDECKESFLQTTIHENSFMPIPEKGYCSTAVKDKTKEDSLFYRSDERSTVICRDLFGTSLVPLNQRSDLVVSPEVPELVIVASSNLDPTSSSESRSEDRRLSSQTYVMSPEVPRLATIIEDSEDSRSNSNSRNVSKVRPNELEFTQKHEKATILSKESDFKKVTLALDKEVGNPLSSSDVVSVRQIEENGDSNIASKAFTLSFSPPRPKAVPSNIIKPNVLSSKQNVEEKSITSQDRRPTRFSKISSSSIKASPSKKSSPFKRRPVVKSVKPSSKTGLSLIKAVSTTNRKLLPSTKPLTPMVRHPNLFAARNIYYDERWVEKQERGFTKWLNFIMTSSEDLTESSVSQKMDAAKLWTACSKDVKVPRAPTREVLSFRAYTAGKEMNYLRISACRLWQSSSVIKVITRLEIEIEKKRLYVRDDRSLNKDVGMKHSFLSLLLNYNPLWLRIGLETVYGEVLPINGNADIVGISRFIITRLLSNPDILEEFSHPTVPHLYKPGHEEALKKFTLKKFLQLIFFLDYAKNKKLIKHNPCLFCKDSDFKMSRDLLVEFSKEFLAGEGDITKHLRYFGYDVTHKQTVLDEFDYAVTNFATDLRCGVRLCRVIELLLDNDCTKKLRMPAQSRLQKIHNVSIAFDALKSSHVGVPKDIEPKDIVNGHMEKTLSLIWHIIFGFRLSSVLSDEKWEKEITHLFKSLKVRAIMNETASTGLKFIMEKEAEVDSGEETEPVAKYILKWSRLVCAHYGVKVENLTVSFSDGRALCLLIHHYYNSFLLKKEIMMNTTVSLNTTADVLSSIEHNRKRSEELLNNEKKNFRLFHDKVNELGGIPILIRYADMSNTIPDRKVTMTFLAFMAARLLDLSEEITAARTIQLAWRKRIALKEKRIMELRNQAATRIQRFIRVFLKRRQILMYNKNVLIIQKYYRGFLARKRVKEIRIFHLTIAANRIQSWFKSIITRNKYIAIRKKIILAQSFVRMKIARIRFLKLKFAAFTVQRRWRAVALTSDIRNKYVLQRSAAIIIQKNFKAFKERRKYLKTRRAAIIIQSNWRRRSALNTLNKVKGCIIILQALTRGRRDRKEFLRIRSATMLLQDKLRAYLSGKRIREEYLKKQRAVVKLQRAFRLKAAKSHHLKLLKTVIFVQACIRGKKQRGNYLRMRFSVITIQRFFRSQIATRKLREDYIVKRQIVIRLQAVLKCRILRLRFLALKKSAIHIQARWRGQLARRKFIDVRKNVITIQSLIRAIIVRRRFLKLKKTVLLIEHKRLAKLDCRKLRLNFFVIRSRIICVQSLVRGFIDRRTFLKKRAAVLSIQSYWRGFIERRTYKEKLEKIVIIQSLFRCYLNRTDFLKKRNAAIIIQRRWKSTLKTLKCRREFVLMKVSALKIERCAKRYLEWKNDNQRRKCAELIYNYWKSYHIRKQYLEDLRRIVKTQSYVRGFLASKNFQRKRFAAKTIQDWWKRISIERREREVYEKTRHSAVIIQSLFRSFITRKRYLKKLRRVIIVQSVVRRYLAVKRYADKKFAASIIQAHWRAIKIGSLERKNIKSIQRATLILQSHVRGFFQRKRFAKIKRSTIFIQNRFRYLILLRKIVVIQAFVRKYIMKKKYVKRKAAAIIIQSKWKDILKLKEFENQKKAAIIIQSWVRGLRDRKRFMKVRSCIIMLQSVMRSRVETRKYQALKTAAVSIQSIYRGHIERKKMRQMISAVVFVQRTWRTRRLSVMNRKTFQLKRNAAIKIQSQWRSYFERNRFEVLKKVVIRVQRKWRALKSRSRFLACVQSAIKIQSAFRRFYHRRLYLRKKNSAVLIQTVFRGHVARNVYRTRMRQVLLCQSVILALHYRRKYVKLRRATILIQSMWRMTRLREQFKSLRSVVSKLQDSYRNRKIRRKFVISRASCIVIQRAWRAYLKKVSFLRQKKSAVCIQNWWRSIVYSRNQRQEFIKLKYSATLIQRWYRGSVESRSRFLSLRRAALKIQRMWRVKLLRKTLFRKRMAALIIQSVVRRYLRRKRHNKLINSITGLQSAIRGRNARNSHQKLLENTDYVEALERERLRREIVKNNVAATCIQHHYRGWMLRNKFRKLVSSVVKIQSFWRGYRVRTRNMDVRDSRLSDVRARLIVANSEATEDRKLCNRVTCALDYLYDIKDVADLIRVVRDLDVSTRHSQNCCDQMLDQGKLRPVKILLDLIARCNRSLPHMEVISGVMDVFLNLSRYDIARSSIASLPETYETILDTLNRFKENQLDIFVKGISFLFLLTQESVGIEKLRPYSNRLSYYANYHERRFQKANLRSKKKTTTTNNNVRYIPLYPEWVCTKKFTRHFDDPAKAVRALLDKFS